MNILSVIPGFRSHTYALSLIRHCETAPGCTGARSRLEVHVVGVDSFFVGVESTLANGNLPGPGAKRAIYDRVGREWARHR